ncbi:MAG TPA: peptidase M23 [Gammaproteobacteria bacterium]|nr:peptidase M23 [Gammaproteobacteria bacterium]
MLALATAAFMSSVLFTSCQQSNSQKLERSQEKVSDAQQDLNKANNDYMMDVENYKRDLRARIDENDRKIDQLQTEKKYQKGETKEAYKARIDNLKDRNRELRKRLDDYQPDNKESWEQFKREFNHDMDEFANSFKDIGRNNVN